MTTPIPLNLAFEDALTESLALKILKTIPVGYATRTIYNRGDYGYLKRTINGFNNAAKGTPFLVGTDVDRYECPPALINDWLTKPKHHNLLIRVAVREAEAWVLADRDSFANFLGIRAVTVPDDVEALPNPKATLIQLARRARKKQLRDDICPTPQQYQPGRAQLQRPHRWICQRKLESRCCEIEFSKSRQGNQSPRRVSPRMGCSRLKSY
jgi:hypothetical protein